MTPSLALALLLTLGGSAEAREPGADRWTRVTVATQPEHIVNFATMSEQEARQLLESADAPLLYDRVAGYDAIPEGGFRLRSRRRLLMDDGFVVAEAPEGGWGLWQSYSRKADDRDRIDAPDRPILRVMGLPASMSRFAWGRVSPYDPLVIEFEDRLFVAQYVSVRVRDPLDPTLDGSYTQLVTGTMVPLSSLVVGDRASWRLVLTLGGRTRSEPRLAWLPVDETGALDLERDGLLMRFSVAQGRVDPWARTLEDAVVPTVVRIHFGDRDSLNERLQALPPPPRERYAEPGSPNDPLMIAPRTPRDPLGAGVEVRSLMLGDLTMVDLNATSQVGGRAVVPRWDGLDASGWVGRVQLGASIRDDLVAGRVMGRFGRMRDTHYTAVGVELGAHPGAVTRFGPQQKLAVNAVLQSARLTGRYLLDQPIEMGNRFRVGTTGLEYEATGGMRLYVKRGFVITPTAMGGFRYSLRGQRAYVVFGGGVELTSNQNVFRR